MREGIRRPHKALSTDEGYVFWLRRYLTALREMPEDLASEQKLEQFLTDLARRREVSASTQNQAPVLHRNTAASSWVPIPPSSRTHRRGQPLQSEARNAKNAPESAICGVLPNRPAATGSVL
jgi:hypothetical protein